MAMLLLSALASTTAWSQTWFAVAAPAVASPLRGSPRYWPVAIRTIGGTAHHEEAVLIVPASADGRLSGSQYLAHGSSLDFYYREEDVHGDWVGPYPIPIRDVNYLRHLDTFDTELPVPGLTHLQRKEYWGVAAVERFVDDEDGVCPDETGSYLEMVATTSDGELVYLRRPSGADYMWNGPIWLGDYVLNPEPWVPSSSEAGQADPAILPSTEDLGNGAGVPAMIVSVGPTGKQRLHTFVPDANGDILHLFCSKQRFCAQNDWVHRPAIVAPPAVDFVSVAAIQPAPETRIHLVALGSDHQLYHYYQHANGSDLWDLQATFGSGSGGRPVLLDPHELLVADGAHVNRYTRSGWTWSLAASVDPGFYPESVTAYAPVGRVDPVTVGQEWNQLFEVDPLGNSEVVVDSVFVASDPYASDPTLTRARTTHLGALTRWYKEDTDLDPEEDTGLDPEVPIGGPNNLQEVGVGGSGSTNVFTTGGGSQLTFFFGDPRLPGSAQECRRDFWADVPTASSPWSGDEFVMPQLEFHPGDTCPVEPVVVVDANGDPLIDGGGFEVPTGAIELGGATYVFYVTDFVKEQYLEVLTLYPDPPNIECSPDQDSPKVVPEYNTTVVLGKTPQPCSVGRPCPDFSSMSAIGTFEGAHRFAHIRPIYDSEGDYVYLFGTGEPKRMSPIFLARVHVPNEDFDALGDRTRWSYLMGWYEDEPVWSADGAEEGVAYPLTEDACMQEVSVARHGSGYLMVFQCSKYGPDLTAIDRGIHFQTAEHPWGPWSADDGLKEEEDLFFDPLKSANRDYHGLGVTAHRRVYDPELQEQQNPDDGLGEPDALMHADEDATGGGFGAYLVLPWYREDDDGEHHYVNVLSTWNPYKVHLFETVLVEDGVTATLDDPDPTVTDPLSSRDFEDFAVGWAGDMDWEGTGFGVVCPGLPEPCLCSDPAEVGRRYQEFQIGDNDSLKFRLLGGEGLDAYVALAVLRVDERGTQYADVVRKTYATPPGTAALTTTLYVNWDVAELHGRTVRLEIVDQSTTDSIQISGFNLQPDDE